ncbi:MAG: hypothetical protein WC346_17065 [Methanogenium sp.]|jgi:hypothetical protein
MKILELTIGSRFAVINFLNTRKGFDLTKWKMVLKIVEKIELTKEDRERVNLRQDGNSIKWDKFVGGVEDAEVADIPVSIELSDEQGDLLFDLIKEAGTKLELSTADVGLLPVYEQLNKV